MLFWGTQTHGSIHRSARIFCDEDMRRPAAGNPEGSSATPTPRLQQAQRRRVMPQVVINEAGNEPVAVVVASVPT